MADCPLVVEALAIGRGITLVKEKKYKNVELEMNSHIVHSEIMKKKQNSGRFGLL